MPENFRKHRYTYQLVLGRIAAILDHRLDPPRHRLDQAPQVFLRVLHLECPEPQGERGSWLHSPEFAAETSLKSGAVSKFVSKGLQPSSVQWPPFSLQRKCFFRAWCVCVSSNSDARAVLTGRSDFCLRTSATEAAANQLVKVRWLSFFSQHLPKTYRYHKTQRAACYHYQGSRN